MNTTQSSGSVLLGLVGIVVLLIANAWLSYQNVRQVHEDGRWVVHTHEVMDTLQQVLVHLHEAEAGQRTYLISGDDAVLRTVAENIDAAKQKAARVKDLTEDNPAQQTRMPELQKRIEELGATWFRTAALRKEQGFDAARQIILAGRSGQMMADLGGLIREMDEAERTLLHERQGATERVSAAIVTGMLAAALGLGAVGMFFWLLERSQQQRQRAAAMIHEQRQLLHATLASIGDAVIATDLAGRVTFLNPVARQLTGWTQTEAEGQPLEVVFHILNEDTRKQVDNPALRALKEGAIVGLANHTILISKDGIERPIHDSAAPIRTEGGKVSGAVLVFRDISDRHLAEKALAESEARHRHLAEFQRAVMDNMGEGLYTVDGEGQVTYVNPAAEALFGYSASELMGRKMHELTHYQHPDGAPFPIEECAGFRVLHDGAALRDYDDVFIRKDGTFFPVRFSSSRLEVESQAVGLVVVFQDMTERKQAVESLKEADRRKDEFLAMLAHELRNPLAPIRNAVTLLRRSDGADRKVVREATEMIGRQVNQMVRFVDDLLDVSRVSRGKFDLRRERTELASVVHHAVEAVLPACEAKGQELTVTLSEEPVYLNADPARLAQVVGNLLSNAAKFTGPHGHIRLTAGVEGGQVVIRVADSGIGIAGDQLSHIFELFTQLDTSLERTESGLGIGLTLVKNLVEMHGGTIRVNSAGLGQGAEFVVRLPRLTEPAPPLPRPAPAAAGPSVPRRVLIVDDNRDGADSLALFMKLAGNEAHTAYDGPEALERAAELRPDVILLDIGLPKINGYEVARRLRQQFGPHRPLLVAMTGYGQDEDRQRAQEAGFDRHLVKPVDPDALNSLLASLEPGQ